MTDHTAAGPRPTAAELLARYSRSGDEAAFAELARRHGGMIAGVCARVLNQPPGAPDAEDAAQATLLVLAQKAHSVHDPSRLSAWLHGVALRHAKRLRAARTRRQRREGPFAVEPPAPERDDWSEVRGVIDDEVARLPAKLRAAFVLCELRGVSRADAACQLAIGDGTLSSRLARAKERLRVRLTRRGVTVAGGTLAGVFEASAAGAQVGAAGLGRFPSQAAMNLAFEEPSMFAVSWPVRLLMSALAVMALTWAGLTALVEPQTKPAPVADAEAVERQRLAGEYIPKLVRENGKWVKPTDKPGERQGTMQFWGDGTAVMPNIADKDKGTGIQVYRVYPNFSPKRIEVRLRPGVPEQEVTSDGVHIARSTQPIRAVYELNGDELTICTSLDGTWPTGLDGDGVSIATRDSAADPRITTRKESVATFGKWTVASVQAPGPGDSAAFAPSLVGKPFEFGAEFVAGNFKAKWLTYPHESPAEIDLIVTDSPDPKLKGRKLEGIYKIEGDRLTLHLASPEFVARTGKKVPRPAGWTAAADGSTVVITLARPGP